MLPETPRSSNSLEFPPTTVQKHLPPPPPPPSIVSAERNLAWQSLPSHDSLDSGVYSRSTTSDSNSGARGAATSPLSNGMEREPSPPSFARQQFRVRPERPETAIHSGVGSSSSSCALLRRRSGPLDRSSHLFASTDDCVSGGSGSVESSAVAGTSSPHRAFSRHYYHYSCYAAEAGAKVNKAHMRETEAARGHRVRFDAFMEDMEGAKNSDHEESQVYPPVGGGGDSSPLLPPRPLHIAQSNSESAESTTHCDYVVDVDVGEEEEEVQSEGDIAETQELSTVIGAAVTTTTEELYYTNAEEDEELLADVDDDDDAFFVDGCPLASPTAAASPPPEALRNSSNREIAQVVNRRIRAMLTQDYNSVVEPAAPAAAKAAVAEQLEVPKLRELKSHSFPPPWRLDDGGAFEQPPCPLVIPDPSSPPYCDQLLPGVTACDQGSAAAAARLEHACPAAATSSSPSLEQRRRWLFRSHAPPCAGGDKGAGVAIEAHQG